MSRASVAGSLDLRGSLSQEATSRERADPEHAPARGRGRGRGRGRVRRGRREGHAVEEPNTSSSSDSQPRRRRRYSSDGEEDPDRALARGRGRWRGRARGRGRGQVHRERHAVDAGHEEEEANISSSSDSIRGEGEPRRRIHDSSDDVTASSANEWDSDSAGEDNVAEEEEEEAEPLYQELDWRPCTHCGAPLLYAKADVARKLDESRRPCCLRGRMILRQEDWPKEHPAEFQRCVDYHLCYGSPEVPTPSHLHLRHQMTFINNTLSLAHLGVQSGLTKNGVSATWGWGEWGPHCSNLHLSGRTYVNWNPTHFFATMLTSEFDTDGGPHPDPHIKHERRVAVVALRMMLRKFSELYKLLDMAQIDAEHARIDGDPDACVILRPGEAPPTGDELCSISCFPGGGLMLPTICCGITSATEAQWRASRNPYGLRNEDGSLKAQFIGSEWPFEAAILPLLLPRGKGGWYKFVDKEGDVHCPKSTTGTPIDTVHAFAKAVLYQRTGTAALARCGNVWELFTLQSASLALRIRAAQLLNNPNIQHVYNQTDAAEAHRPQHPQAPTMATQLPLSEKAKRVRQRKLLLGHWLLIPRSVRGSPAFMRELIANGMAVITHFGEPQFFITFTANPQWPEVKSWLQLMGMPNGSILHHPEIMQRIFDVKLRQLLADLRNGEIFGAPSVYLQYTVEWQKRGIPHAHIILKVEGRPIDQATQADKFVCARRFRREECLKDLPRESNECNCDAHLLARLVGKHMQHSCKKRQLTCHRKDKKDGVLRCRFRFPQEECTLSESTPDGRWKLRRGQDDLFTVTYNPELLLKYQAHINVELCHGPACAYYIRKYITKLPDSIRAAVVEIKRGATRLEDLKTATTNFQTMRYMGSGEAAAECLGHHRQGCEPRCITIQINLPGEGQVLIPENATLEQADETRANKEDALMRYTWRPTEDQFSDLTINQYYEQYTLSKTPPKRAQYWCDEYPGVPNYVFRRPTKAVVRFQTSIASGRRGAERYALGLLLQHIPCRLTRTLRADPDFPDTVYETYSEAASIRGLLGGDRGLAYAMMDVINRANKKSAWFEELGRTLPQTAATGDIVTSFFITLARGGIDETDPINAKQLFAWFWPYMCMPMALRYDDIAAYDDLRTELARRLHTVGWTLADIGIENESMSSAAAERQSEIKRFQQQSLAAALALELSPDQREGVERVMRALDYRRQHPTAAEDTPDDPQRLFLLKGPAGSGKTRTINVLLARARRALDVAIPTAFMAVAANMTGGDTCHRTFGLKVTPGEEPSRDSTLTKGSRRGARLIAADLIIIDEISMVHGNYLEAIHRILVNLTGDDRPFGGKVVLCVGDFKQLAPVVVGGGQAQTIAASPASRELFAALSSEKNEPIILRRIFRQQDHTAFAAWCLLLGQGCTNATRCEECWGKDATGKDAFHPPPEDEGCQTCDTAPFGMHELHAHEGMFSTPLFNRIGAHTDMREAHIHYFGGEDEELLKAEHVERLAKNKIIAFRNDVVDEHNKEISERWQQVNKTRQWTALSTDTVDKKSTTEAVFLSSVSLLNAQRPIDAPPHKLNLFVGAVLSLMRNLNPLEGLFNTATLIVQEQSTQSTLWVKVLETGRTLPIPRVTFKCVGNGGTVRFTRRQFPVKFAYASTVNRVQGATLTEQTVVDLRATSFTHGQLYVALTRNTNPRDIFVLLPEIKTIIPSTLPHEDAKHAQCNIINSIVYADLLRLGLDNPRDYHVKVSDPTPLQRRQNQEIETEE